MRRTSVSLLRTLLLVPALSLAASAQSFTSAPAVSSAAPAATAPPAMASNAPDAVASAAAVAAPAPPEAPEAPEAASAAAPATPINASVHDGKLTVDYSQVDTNLNYTIKNANFLYFYVPGVGTAVVSLTEQPGSVKVANAFNGNALRFDVGGHRISLVSDGPLLAGGTADAYVRFDYKTQTLTSTPMLGFGETAAAPYRWPMPEDAQADAVQQRHFTATPGLNPHSVVRDGAVGN